MRLSPTAIAVLAEAGLDVEHLCRRPRPQATSCSRVPFGGAEARPRPEEDEGRKSTRSCGGRWRPIRSIPSWLSSASDRPLRRRRRRYPASAKAATPGAWPEVLRPMMVEAANASDAAQIAQALYASAFYEAHRKLQYLHKCRTDGRRHPQGRDARLLRSPHGCRPRLEPLKRKPPGKPKDGERQF